MRISDWSSDVCSSDLSGSTTAPAHTLYDIVRKLPEGAQVEIEAGGEDSRLKLKAGRSTFTLATLPREDFPLTSGDDLPQAFPLQASELRTLIEDRKSTRLNSSH